MTPEQMMQMMADLAYELQNLLSNLDRQEDYGDVWYDFTGDVSDVDDARDTLNDYEKLLSEMKK